MFLTKAIEKFVVNVNFGANSNNLYSSSTDFNILDNNLTDPKVHEGKIIAATIESINKRANNKVHFDLTIKLK